LVGDRIPCIVRYRTQRAAQQASKAAFQATLQATSVNQPNRISFSRSRFDSAYALGRLCSGDAFSFDQVDLSNLGRKGQADDAQQAFDHSIGVADDWVRGRKH
jgi:hypothetical protein